MGCGGGRGGKTAEQEDNQADPAGHARAGIHQALNGINMVQMRTMVFAVMLLLAEP